MADKAADGAIDNDDDDDAAASANAEPSARLESDPATAAAAETGPNDAAPPRNWSCMQCSRNVMLAMAAGAAAATSAGTAACDGTDDETDDDETDDEDGEDASHGMFLTSAAARNLAAGACAGRVSAVASVPPDSSPPLEAAAAEAAEV
jgi:hypothetical protein